MATDLAERRFSTGLRWNEVMNFSLWIEVSFLLSHSLNIAARQRQAAEMCMLEENWDTKIPRRFARSQLTIALSFRPKEEIPALRRLRYWLYDVEG